MESIGKYKVIREAGRGATATVYLCENPENGESVAVKLVRFDQSAEGQWNRRIRKLFATEGKVGRVLDHPNIVKVFETVIEEEQAYIVMEFLQGDALDQFVTFDKLLPVHQVVGIIFKCCLALDHAFKQGVVHRDIKPANIMMVGEEDVKITDFGLALDISKKSDTDSTFIMGVGSPAYMSPEQIKGYALNQKTDLYSLGVVLFQMLTGRLPFRANNQATLVYKIINTDAPPVTALNPSLPESVNPIIKKSLEKDLYTRYKNGAEMAKDLSTVRFQIWEEDDTEQDIRHFEALRKLDFFTEFENVELWEVLRVAVWRELASGVAIVREGETSQTFGIIVRGFVEVSIHGRALCRLGASEVVGEIAYLHPTNKTRHASVVTLEPTLFLEISASALALSSEELLERMRNGLIAKMIDRMRKVNEIAAAQGAPAVDVGTGSLSGASRSSPGSGLDLELAPM